MGWHFIRCCLQAPNEHRNTLGTLGVDFVYDVGILCFELSYRIETTELVLCEQFILKEMGADFGGVHVTSQVC